MSRLGIFGAYKGILSYIFCPVKQLEAALPGARDHAHLEYHLFDGLRVGVPGAEIFSHLRVGGCGTERSIGVPDFQVRETIRTWNAVGLTASELVFQV